MGGINPQFLGGKIMAKLRIRKNENLELDDPAQIDEDLDNLDDKDQVIEDDEEGKGDDPNVSEGEEAPAEDNQENSENHEPELITLKHSVKSGTLILAHRSYEIEDYEVKVLPEDFQACIHHGLLQKE